MWWVLISYMTKKIFYNNINRMLIINIGSIWYFLFTRFVAKYSFLLHEEIV